MRGGRRKTSVLVASSRTTLIFESVVHRARQYAGSYTHILARWEGQYGPQFKRPKVADEVLCCLPTSRTYNQSEVTLKQSLIMLIPCGSNPPWPRSNVWQLADHNVIFRIPTPLFGLGLVEGTPDDTLRANLAANLSAKSRLGIGGTLNASGNDATITRFGWKAQNKSLLIFAAKPTTWSKASLVKCSPMNVPLSRGAYSMALPKMPRTCSIPRGTQGNPREPNG